MTTSTAVEYAKDFQVFQRPVKRFGGFGGYVRGQNVTGYGSRISSDYMIRFNDDTKKTLYRVYVVCYSNCGSHYVIRRGKKLYIRGEFLDATNYPDSCKRFDIPTI